MVNSIRNRMLTTSGVAKMLYVHINTVRRWSDQGILKPYRIGPRGDRRFIRDDIIQYLNTQHYGHGESGSKDNGVK
jgi:excisionase family DNA binding protein